MAADLHFAEDALALHLLLQRLEGLVVVVVADENLHAAFLFDRAVDGPSRQGARANGTWSRTIRVPDGTQRTNQRRYLNRACRWALWLPIERNGEFGTSPFFGQLFGRVSARLYTRILVCRS